MLSYPCQKVSTPDCYSFPKAFSFHSSLKRTEEPCYSRAGYGPRGWSDLLGVGGWPLCWPPPEGPSAIVQDTAHSARSLSAPSPLRFDSRHHIRPNTGPEQWVIWFWKEWGISLLPPCQSQNWALRTVVPGSLELLIFSASFKSELAVRTQRPQGQATFRWFGLPLKLFKIFKLVTTH